MQVGAAIQSYSAQLLKTKPGQRVDQRPLPGNQPANFDQQKTVAPSPQSSEGAYSVKIDPALLEQSRQSVRESSTLPEVFNETKPEENARPTAGDKPSLSGEQLSEEEQQEVAELQQRDREVRSHEMAHKAAAGSYARGGPSFEFTQGPDGRRYATGGQVKLDTGKEATPEATIAKARTIRRAALAPAHPSGTDRQVAARAAQMERQAQAEKRQEAEEQRTEQNAAPGQATLEPHQANPAPAASQPAPTPPTSTLDYGSIAQFKQPAPTPHLLNITY